MSDDNNTLGPIVSSAHLAAGGSVELSEFEFGLIIAHNAFSRWTVRCMAAAGVPDLSPLDVLVLHSISHRDRPKKMADICFVLNVEDTHTVNYALKKLIKMGLVDGEKRGKERFFTTTDEGQQACIRYAEIRRECLL
ncbi:MAG: transcriptional regulator, partial [Hyphomicrobiales bacterium]